MPAALGGDTYFIRAIKAEASDKGNIKQFKQKVDTLDDLYSSFRLFSMK